VYATHELVYATRDSSRIAYERLYATRERRYAMPAGSSGASWPVWVVPFCPHIVHEPMEEAAVATGPMSLQEIITSLEAQAAHHREQLELITRRLEELRTAASAATELAREGRSRQVDPDARLDIGTAAKPQLARMVRQALTEVAPGRPFGPNWVTQEVNRRFGSRLNHPVEVRQISAVLRRMEGLGELKREKSGGPRKETRFVRVG
jgi:hypothetical protein